MYELVCLVMLVYKCLATNTFTIRCPDADICEVHNGRVLSDFFQKASNCDVCQREAESDVKEYFTAPWTAALRDSLSSVWDCWYYFPIMREELAVPSVKLQIK